LAKTLIVYFSLAGHTRQVAEEIARLCGGDLDPIVDAAERSLTPMHLAWFAMEAILHHNMTAIKDALRNPADYDLVIIGTPVWAGHITPPVHSYIEQHKGRLKRVALFCTEGGANGEMALGQAEKLLGIKPQATLVVAEPAMNSGAYRGMVADFVRKIEGITADAASPA
jgi:flavodoxin